MDNNVTNNQTYEYRGCENPNHDILQNVLLNSTNDVCQINDNLNDNLVIDSSLNISEDSTQLNLDNIQQNTNQLSQLNENENSTIINQSEGQFQTQNDQEVNDLQEDQQSEIDDGIDDFISEEDELNVAYDKAGAKILAANKEAKKPQKVIDGDLDTFMMNDCAAEKWIIIELSQRAIIRRISVAITELYTSYVKNFQVYGRERHPRYDNKQGDYSKSINSTSWTLIGNFTADNVRGPQVFTVESQPENHQIAQWLLFKFITHYSNEPVCALNDLKVYGLTEAQMLENRLLHLHKVTQIKDEQVVKQQQQVQQIPQATQTEKVFSGNGQVDDEKEEVKREEEEPIFIQQVPQVYPTNQTQCDVDRVILGNVSSSNLTCCSIDVCFPQDEMVEVRKALPNDSASDNIGQSIEDQKQSQTQSQTETPKITTSQNDVQNQLIINTPKQIQGGHNQGSVYDRIINEMISLKLNQTYTWKQSQEQQETAFAMTKIIESLNSSLLQQVELREREAVQLQDKMFKMQQISNQQSIQLTELYRQIELMEAKFENLTQAVENQGNQDQLILKVLMVMLFLVAIAVLPLVNLDVKMVWLFVGLVGIIGALAVVRIVWIEGIQATTLRAAFSCINHCLMKRT